MASIPMVDHPALLSQAGGLADGVGEGGPVGHGVVGGEGADDGVSSVSWAMTAAARPMAAMESRGEGSARRLSRGMLGSWSATAAMWATPVTTVVVAVTGASRSTVSCRRLRPAPVRSRRNLGRPRRLRGHSRVPRAAG